MFYTVYKITNNINGKVYVGAHVTDDLDDDYMGSGIHIARAIKKHGLDNFTKEILHTFDSVEEMYAKEAEIVNEDFVKRKDTYNMVVGGKGGFEYVNQNGLNLGFKHINENGLSLGFKYINDNKLSPRFDSTKQSEFAKRRWAKFATPEERKKEASKGITSESYKKVSETIKTKGSDWHLAKTVPIHHPNLQQRKRVQKSEVGHYLSEGWKQGTGINPFVTGTIWVTDGIKNKRISPTDLSTYVLSGWRQGKTHSKSCK